MRTHSGSSDHSRLDRPVERKKRRSAFTAFFCDIKSCRQRRILSSERGWLSSSSSALQSDCLCEQYCGHSHRMCQVVSSLPQWSHAAVSAIPMRNAYALVNATPNHNLHSIVASRRRNSGGIRRLRVGSKVPNRAWMKCDSFHCDVVRLRASMRSFRAASVLESGIDISSLSVWAERAARSTRSLPVIPQ